MSFLLNEKFAGRVLYGLITVMALLAVLELHPPSALTAIVTLFGTTLALALAEGYSEAIAHMLLTQQRPTAGEMQHLWQDVAPIISSSQPAILVLVLALLDVISVAEALQIAQIVVIGLLFAYGFRVGRLLHQSLLRQIATGVIMASAGLFIVAIKVFMH